MTRYSVSNQNNQNIEYNNENNSIKKINRKLSNSFNNKNFKNCGKTNINFFVRNSIEEKKEKKIENNEEYSILEKKNKTFKSNKMLIEKNEFDNRKNTQKSFYKRSVVICKKTDEKKIEGNSDLEYFEYVKSVLTNKDFMKINDEKINDLKDSYINMSFI